MDAVSTDDTSRILEEFGHEIIWHRRNDSGQADAINQGLHLASGDIVAWLNSDDLYLPLDLTGLDRLVAPPRRTP